MDVAEALSLIRSGHEGIVEFNRRRQSSEPIFPKRIEPLDFSNQNLQGVAFVAYPQGPGEPVAADLTEVRFYKADLRRADLSRTNCMGANFDFAKMDGTVVHDANMSGCRFGETSLVGASFHKVHFPGSTFIRCSIKNSHFTECELATAELHTCDLSGTKLYRSNLQRTLFRECTMTKTSLRHADLSKAVFEGSIMTKARLRDAKLSETNFEGAKDLRLDGNDLRQLMFPPMLDERWTTLKRQYTGPMLHIHLLLLVLALGGYSARAMFWFGVSKMESPFRGHMPQPLREFRVWELVLGLDRGFETAVLALAIIAYNILRAGLTWRIGLLREEEERTNRAPLWKWKDYRYSFHIHHYFMNWFIVVAGIAFAWNFGSWMRSMVYLP